MSPLYSVLLFAGILVAAWSSPRAKEDSPGGGAVSAAPKLVPCLWFGDRAEEAIRHYGSVFAGVEVLSEVRTAPDGPLVSAGLRVAGQELVVLNGNPGGAFTPAVSLVVRCEDQAEIDHLWAGLTAEGGRAGRCGWLEDRFGVSWQIVPRQLPELLGDPDPARARRVAEALLQMDKLDLARLEQARDGR